MPYFTLSNTSDDCCIDHTQAELDIANEELRRRSDEIVFKSINLHAILNLPLCSLREFTDWEEREALRVLEWVAEKRTAVPWIP
ncbi:hypothetical protein LCGC14_1703590 [marine sediment metagenome]|uniref:Uncharacterized protein n=1 Tax=marine sediment metagenome TaxID=412755 RepID=A0A0F9HHS6_9ZZZZ